MKLTVLGCSGSVTPTTRTCSFRLGERVLIDMGSAASVLSLAEQTAIDDIFLTHAHLDHVKELPSFAENVFASRKTPVRIHARAKTLARLGTHLLNDAVWPDFTKLPTPEAPTLAFVPLEPRARREVDGITITAVDLPHPGGSVAFLLESGEGVLVLCGDTGPTQALWETINALGPRVRALVIETSFPDRLEALAEVSGHLTPRRLAAELAKVRRTDLPVYVHHLKAPTRAETLAELTALGDARLRILVAGEVLEF